MNCSKCGHEASPGAKSCIYCGAALGDAAIDPDVEATEADDLQSVVASLQKKVNLLESQVNQQTQRIFALENVIADAARMPPSSESKPRPGGPAEPPGGTAPAPSTQADAPTPLPHDSEKTDLPSRDWDWLLGGNWLARVGILALVIGIGFFLKLAFDYGWVGETGRVILGLGVGLGLMGCGEFGVRKYPAWARAVTGGGIAILYLVVFAAYALYNLISAGSALGLSSLVTLVAAGLALRYESRAVAILGIIGGFVTPLFLADKLPSQWALLAYLLVLDLGVLALATFRNWRWFNLLAFFGSLALYTYWYEALNPGGLAALVGITVVFLIFVGATTLFNLVWRRSPNFLDKALIVMNGVSYFGISYILMLDTYRAWMGGFTLLLALFYGLLGYGMLTRNREHPDFFIFGMALVFLTLAIPVQFDGPWITMGWAVQMAVLVWLSFFRRMPRLRLAGVVVLALILFRLMWVNVVLLALTFFQVADWRADYFGDDRSYWPVVNWHFLEFVAAVAAIYLSAYFMRRWRDRYFNPRDIQLSSALLVVANGLTLFALSVEIFDTVDRGIFAIAPDIVGNVISLSLSALWTLYAAGLIVMGIVRRNRWLRLAGMGLLAVPIFKLFTFDAFILGHAFRVAAFIGLGLLLVVGGFLYQRYGRAIRGVLLE